MQKTNQTSIISDSNKSQMQQQDASINYYGQSSQQNEQQNLGDHNPNLLRQKTQICRHFTNKGFCKFGDDCQLIHGEGEAKSSRLESRMCRLYTNKGFCKFGNDCQLVHAELEMKNSRSEEIKQPANSIGTQPKSESQSMDIAFLYSEAFMLKKNQDEASEPTRQSSRLSPLETINQIFLELNKLGKRKTIKTILESHLNFKTLKWVVTQTKPKILILYCHGNEKIEYETA